MKHPNCVLNITILICYGAAAGLFALTRNRTEADQSAFVTLIPALVFGVAALLLHGYLLSADTFTDSGLRLSLANTVSLIGVVIALLTVVGSARRGLRGLGALILPLAGLTALATGLGEGRIVGHPGWPMQAHIVLSAVAYSFLSIAAAMAILIAIQDRQLRARQPYGLLRLLPSLESMEQLLFTTLGTGFGLLSLAIFSGLIFVDNMFAQHLVHKTILSLVAWVIFGVLLLGRIKFGWRGKKAIHWTLGGFVVLALAYFGSRLVLEVILGRHWG